jgi:hypothetical protein
MAPYDAVDGSATGTLSAISRLFLLRCMSLVLARSRRTRSGRACPLCPGSSDVNLFCYCEASSTSMPKYRTVLSILVWPKGDRRLADCRSKISCVMLRVEA